MIGPQLGGAESTVVRRITFAHGTAKVVVELPSEPLASAVRGLFPGYSGAGHTGDADLVLTCLPGGNWELTAGDQVSVFDDLTDAVGALEYEITISLLQGLSGFLRLHAAAIAVNGRATVLLGPSGSGKSSLALYACRQGCQVFGDDVVLLDTDARLHGFERMFEVADATARTLGIDLEATPFRSEHSPEVWVDPRLFGGWASPAPIGRVVVLDYDPAAPLSSRAMSPAETAAALVRSIMTEDVGPVSSIDACLSVAQTAPGLVLTYPTAAHAMTLLERAKDR